MDAPAIYALVDVLARIEIDMQTGRSSFAKVNERHAMLCPIPEATADATCRCAPRSRAGVSSARSDQFSRPPRLRRLLPSVLRSAPHSAPPNSKILSDLKRGGPQVTHATPASAE